MPKLKRWFLSSVTTNPYQAPECGTLVLIGTVYDHDDLQDGDPVRTSTLEAFDSAKGIARTRNTVYQLGKPSSFFTDWLKEEGKVISDYDFGDVEKFDEDT